MNRSSRFMTQSKLSIIVGVEKVSNLFPNFFLTIYYKLMKQL